MKTLNSKMKLPTILNWKNIEVIKNSYSDDKILHAFSGLIFSKSCLTLNSSPCIDSQNLTHTALGVWWSNLQTNNSINHKTIYKLVAFPGGQPITLVIISEIFPFNKFKAVIKAWVNISMEFVLLHHRNFQITDLVCSQIQLYYNKIVLTKLFFCDMSSPNFLFLLSATFLVRLPLVGRCGWLLGVRGSLKPKER